jgi:hypothetical protein
MEIILETRAGRRLVLFLAVLVLCGMAYDAVDRVLAPWEPMMWQVAWILLTLFLSWMAFRLGVLFDGWLHRWETTGIRPARRG